MKKILSRTILLIRYLIKIVLFMIGLFGVMLVFGEPRDDVGVLEFFTIKILSVVVIYICYKLNDLVDHIRY